MEAVDAPFPISKRELLDEVEDGTVLLGGRNVALHDLIKDIHDDYFESEEEFLAALETHYSTIAEDEPLTAEGAKTLDAHERAAGEAGRRERETLGRDEPATPAGRREGHI